MYFNIILYISILFTSICFSQKQTEDQFYVASKIENVVIDLNCVFTVKIYSAENNQIVIRTKSEGEYASHFILAKKEINKSIYIEEQIGFTFTALQDKLSAHKVHSIEVDIILPSHLITSVYTDIGNIYIEGNHKLLSTNSSFGNCYLKNVTGKFNINTINGDIDLSVQKGNISSYSKSGVITKQKIPTGLSNFVLKTVKGNINIVKPE